MTLPLHFTIHNVNDRTIFRPTIDISTRVAIITCRLTYYYTVWNLSRNAFISTVCVSRCLSTRCAGICASCDCTCVWVCSIHSQRDTERPVRERFCADSPFIRLHFHCALCTVYRRWLCALLQRGFWRMNCLRAHMFGWRRGSASSTHGNSQFYQENPRRLCRLFSFRSRFRYVHVYDSLWLSLSLRVRVCESVALSRRCRQTHE